MKLELARSAGFCYGVRRAVELAEQAAAQGTPCVMLGSIIHNQAVIGRLAEQGLRSGWRVGHYPLPRREPRGLQNAGESGRPDLGCHLPQCDPNP